MTTTTLGARTIIAPTLDLALPNITAEKIISLEREQDAFVLHPQPAWWALLHFAYAMGGWSPLGTDAPVAYNLMAPQRPAGHYYPSGQTVSARDAAALGRALAKARDVYLRDYLGVWPRPNQWGSLTHRLLWPHLEAPLSCDPRDWDRFAFDRLWDGGLADYLQRGAFRVTTAWPPEFRAREAEAGRAAERARLVARRARLSRLYETMPEYVFTETIVPQLVELSEQIQQLDATPTTQPEGSHVSHV